MGFLTITRREGESIRLTIDPGVDTDKLLALLLRDGITIHMHRVQRDGHIRVGIEAPKQVKISRDELVAD
ncbi:carbon storage regulator [Aquipseudomonas alcaligenes]|uniref:Carbon storage regulator, CsrA n=1 Tax=Aquipseudomonas alcaligenes TaxID=43263 RepID=A0A1N6NPS0_AQUAC|nr:carbon storage regulator [Pseudomonas alcaligenes]SIP94081.1 carbon storage regulator, CsrA [Pseudomonas alcaligenes]